MISCLIGSVWENNRVTSLFTPGGQGYTIYAHREYYSPFYFADEDEVNGASSRRIKYPRSA